MKQEDPWVLDSSPESWLMRRRCVSQNITGLQKKVRTGKLFFLFLNQDICCGYSEEPSQ